LYFQNLEEKQLKTINDIYNDIKIKIDRNISTNENPEEFYMELLNNVDQTEKQTIINTVNHELILYEALMLLDPNISDGSHKNFNEIIRKLNNLLLEDYVFKKTDIQYELPCKFLIYYLMDKDRDNNKAVMDYLIQLFTKNVRRETIVPVPMGSTIVFKLKNHV
jgi:disulfide oxidoreductase YuzD